jgi:uncharacterized paraquat-inducible protein A
MIIDQPPALAADAPAVKPSHKRMACAHCGTHVMVSNLMYAPGGQCPCCESYELLAVPASPYA